MRARLLIALVAVLAGPCSVLADKVRVPTDQPTIPSSVNAATDGDTSLVAPNQSMRRSLSDFVTPDGRFDLEATRRSGYQGSLDIRGCHSAIDSATGKPIIRRSASSQPSDDPDDVYWDNSISLQVKEIPGGVLSATVYDGQLVVGGYFDSSAGNIAAWNGTSWSALGSGVGGPEGPMSRDVNALTVYDGQLIAGGNSKRPVVWR